MRRKNYDKKLNVSIQMYTRFLYKFKENYHYYLKVLSKLLVNYTAKRFPFRLLRKRLLQVKIITQLYGSVTNNKKKHLRKHLVY